MGEIDLDAMRAARAEARAKAGDEKHTFVFGGETFDLPAELDLDLGVSIMNGNVWGSLTGLVGDQWDRFYAHKPHLEDAVDLVRSLAPLYGFADPGESPASPSSSASNGSPPRPTSPGTTASTSRKRASAKPKNGRPSAG